MVKRDLLELIFWFLVRWGISALLLYFFVVEGCGEKYGWDGRDGKPTQFALKVGFVLALFLTFKAWRNRRRDAR